MSATVKMMISHSSYKRLGTFWVYPNIFTRFCVSAFTAESNLDKDATAEANKSWFVNNLRGKNLRTNSFGDNN